MIKFKDMKAFQTVLLAVLLLFCPAAFAQTVNSSVTIKIDRGNYVVSGIVAGEAYKNEIIQRIKTQLGGNADFSRISVSANADPFQNGWLTEFDKTLAKIKTWRSGIAIFSYAERSYDKDFPPLPAEIMNARFLLSDGQTVSLKDYQNKLIVLFFLESWAAPVISQAAILNEIYAKTSSRNIEIIGLSSETEPEDRNALRKFFKKQNLQFKFGWTDSEMFQNFVKISKLNGVPQAFIILDGKLHGVFAGGGTRTTERLKETILKTLDDNNL
jgi:peroxiredoxin